MLDKILTYLKFGNRFYGMEHTQTNSREHLHVTVLKKSKQELDIEDSFEADSIADLKSRLDKNQAIHLTINNNYVLTKQVESELLDNNKLINKAFPNINIQDFFHEILHQGNQHFISICRKDYVERLVSSYQENKISIIGISLGNSIINCVKYFVDSDQITTSNSFLSIKDGKIHTINPKTDNKLGKYNINGLQVDSDQLLSFSGALTQVVKNQNTVSNLETKVMELTSEYNHRRFFHLFLRSGLGFIFTVLLVNFFVFNSYFNKVNDLQQVTQVNQSNREQLVKLKERVERSEKMVGDILKSNASKSSLYANEIVHSMPNTILLNGLDYQPLLKRVKEGQSVEVENDVILVSGESNDSDRFSGWISDLERRSWTEEIQTVSYRDRTNRMSNFSFKIILKDGQ